MTRRGGLMRGIPAIAMMAIFFVACGGGGGGYNTGASSTPAATATPPPPATPPCEGARRMTPSRDAGSHFKPGSPERASLLEPGLAGTPLTITGVVLSASCGRVAGAQLDFWQADDTGAYDSAPDRLRGHQSTGTDGRYRLETIVPGIEPGRARHISVTVKAPDGPPLTTELYFAGDASNAGDVAFDASLALSLETEGGVKVAGFDFVLP